MKRGVIKVAKKGFDVRYAHPRNLTIDSTKNQFKVHMKGRGKVTITDTEPSTFMDIEHNLGYQPVVKVWTKEEGEPWFPTPSIGSPSAAGFSRIDDNTLRVQVYVWDIFLFPPLGPGFSDFDVDIKYVIYVDPNRNVWNT